MSSDKPPVPKVRIGSKPPDTTLAIKIDLPEPSIEMLAKIPRASDEKTRENRGNAAKWIVKGTLGKGVSVKETENGSGVFVYYASGTGLVLSGDPNVLPEPEVYHYHTMPRTMEGFKQFKISVMDMPPESRLRRKMGKDELSFRFFHTRTKGVFFLYYDVFYPEFYEVPRLMSAEVKFDKVDRILDENGEGRFISRITPSELASLIRVAKATASMGTIAVKEDSDNNTLEVLQKRLKMVSALQPLAADFSMKLFVAGMKFSYPSMDDLGDYYGIISGEGDVEDYHRLYVNPGFGGTPDGCVAVATFRYNHDHCMLFREV